MCVHGRVWVDCAHLCICPHFSVAICVCVCNGTYHIYGTYVYVYALHTHVVCGTVFVLLHIEFVLLE